MSSDDFLTKLIEDETTLLKQWISEIEEDIKKRKELRDSGVSSLKGSLEEIEEKLERIEHWEPGYKPSVNHMRMGLEKEKNLLKKEEKFQKISAWSEIEKLKKELRIILKEYEKAKRKEDIIDGVKEDNYGYR